VAVNCNLFRTFVLIFEEVIKREVLCLLCFGIGQHLFTELAACNDIRQQSRDDTIFDGGDEHFIIIAVSEPEINHVCDILTEVVCDTDKRVNDLS